jgi:RNA polymerase sporulation-specific sigma factor
MDHRYLSYSQETLLKLAQKKDNIAMEFLIEKYKGLVRKKARSLYLMGGDKDDLVQEGMVGLFKAIRDFDTSSQVVFSAFADLCISRQLYTAIRSSNRKKNIPLNSYVSLDDENWNMNDRLHTMNSNITCNLSSEAQNPENIYVEKEYVNHILKRAKELFSPLEHQIFDLYLSGATYSEISDELNKSPKSIENAMQRIRKKILKIQE